MTRFIAEFTTNHMGNLNLLFRMVRKAKESGADLIKMQSKDVENFYDKKKLDASFMSPYGKTYREYRTLFEFDIEDMFRFDDECYKNDIRWYTTIQEINSLKKFLQVEYIFNSLEPMLKISSSGARDDKLIEEFVKKVPKTFTIVVSVAGLLLSEIREIIRSFQDYNMIIQHCVAEYPTVENNLRLGNLPVLLEEFESDKVKIGYSSHYAGIADVTSLNLNRLETIEKHFCISRNSFVHHIECSLEPDEFKRMVELKGSRTLSPDAYETSFGMSNIEVEFLEKQTYGNTFLGEKSEWQ